MMFLYVFMTFLTLFIIYKITLYLMKKGTVGYRLIAILIPMPFVLFNLQAFDHYYIPFFNIDTDKDGFIFYLPFIFGYLYCAPYIIVCRKDLS